MADVADRPLLAHTLDAVSQAADLVVVATREDLVDHVSSFAPGVVVVKGGHTRTDSELAGLTALGREFDLIGVHDGARPLVSPELIETLYKTAHTVGGAVPAQDVQGLVINRLDYQPVDDVVRMQTPQVFRGPELLAGYVKAAQSGFEGHDTVDVIMRFTDLEIEAVQGDPDNIKVTFPEDLEYVRKRLEGPSRSEPR